jgi:thymidylate synthase (FAD)
VQNKVEVLNEGYVRLVDHMGNDVSIVNAARVSFDRETSLGPDGKLKDKDIRLMHFLYQRREMSVFRQATVQFEMHMPLMTARQYWKYIIAVANTGDGVCMNESSRRYITEEPTFYIPGFTEWRGTPEDKKQGSGAPLDPRIGEVASKQLLDYVDQGLELYNYWISIGIAPEQARLFLPAYGMYIRMRTTMSLAALLHFLDERLEHKAQHEIFVYAQAMRTLVEPLFPAVFEAVFGAKDE